MRSGAILLVGTAFASDEWIKTEFDCSKNTGGICDRNFLLMPTSACVGQPANWPLDIDCPARGEAANVA
jgi:hypothetical protein